MPKYLSQKEAFKKCEIEGKFIPQESIDISKIKAMLEIAESDFKSAKELKKILSKESKQWSSIYKLYYDSLHELAEAFLYFDKIKSDNHQCLFAYLCEKHPELELNWDFFEKIRTKRNGISYYGTRITYQEVKEIEIQIDLYFYLIKKRIEKKLKIKK